MRPTMITICDEIQKIKHRLTVASNLGIGLPYYAAHDLLQADNNVRPKTLLEQQIVTIKEIYRERYKRYNPFYFDLNFQFDMNSWIPIKLVVEDKVKERQATDAEGIGNDQENELFQLITDGLKRFGLVVITGTILILNCFT
jgi:hypothetical protein